MKVSPRRQNLTGRPVRLQVERANVRGYPAAGPVRSPVLAGCCGVDEKCENVGMPYRPPRYRPPRTAPDQAAARPSDPPPAVLPDRPARPSAAARGYGRDWQRARLAFLADNPACVQCEAAGRLSAATDVDHITPHKGNPALFWDWSNWQGLTNECHEKKTAAENAQRNSGGKRRFTDSAMEPGWVD